MHDSSEPRRRIDVHPLLAVGAPWLTLYVRRPGIALPALVITLACAGPAGASGVTVYGGTVEDGGPLALELTETTGLLAPLGRLTLSTVASCPDEDPPLILSVNQAIVSPFNIPEGDVL